jgi:hypothetical protein
VKTLGREERDLFGPKDRGIFGIGGIEHSNGVDAARVVECEIYRCRSGSVMRDRDDLIKAQHLDDRFVITELLLETISSTGWFVGTAKTQEIECDDP